MNTGYYIEAWNKYLDYAWTGKVYETLDRIQQKYSWEDENEAISEYKKAVMVAEELGFEGVGLYYTDENGALEVVDEAIINEEED